WPLITRQVERLGLCRLAPGFSGDTFPNVRRAKRIARPKLQHAMLFLRCDGPLGFHIPAPGFILALCLARAWHVLAKKIHGRAVNVASHSPSYVSWTLP